MSLQTWKKEFYPIPAEQVLSADAVAHSLRKWEGLKPKNLAKHDLISHGEVIIDDDGNELGIDASSCALCNHYIDDDCAECPLALVRGGVSCAMRDSPYHAFMESDDPNPMIKWLKKAMTYEETQNATG